MRSSRVMRRCGGAAILVFVLTAIHGCRIPLCGCAPPLASVDGRWTGRTEAGDELTLDLDHDRGAMSFTGTGRVGRSPTYRSITVVGSMTSEHGSIHRFWISGWQDTPVEFVADRDSPWPRADGELRFANGESTRVRLQPENP
jgi:hypothetical protein